MKWAFKSLFRRQAFGWEPEPAVAAIEEALAEIQAVERWDARRAGEGAVSFFMRVSPALELVDTSSGEVTAALERAVEDLAPIIGGAPADGSTRGRWLERLFAAHGADRSSLLLSLGERWGDLCGSKAIASVWAERLLPYTRLALGPDPDQRGSFHGTMLCLSALFAAERHDELMELVEYDSYWPFRRWAVRSMAVTGKKAEALRLAEELRPVTATPEAIDEASEAILLSSGLHEQAYARYALRANRRATLLETFRALTDKYPRRAPRDILVDVGGDDPRTLMQAARDHVDLHPSFALEAGLLALEWFAAGRADSIAPTDLHDAYLVSMQAAEATGRVAETAKQMREWLITAEALVRAAQLAPPDADKP